MTMMSALTAFCDAHLGPKRMSLVEDRIKTMARSFELEGAKG